MKLKKLFFISFTILLVFLIYLATVNKKVYYLNLGDSIAMGVNSYKVKGQGYDNYIIKYLKKEEKLEKYINNFNQKDLRITDLYNMIDNNYEIRLHNRSQNIKNALIKADIVTLAITNDDFYQKLNSNYNLNELYELVDSYKNDMENLILLIKKYCKEDIIMVGYYNPYNNEKSEKIVTYMNKKMIDLAAENEIKYINLQNIINSKYVLNFNDYHISNEGYELIGEEIIKIIKKDIL